MEEIPIVEKPLVFDSITVKIEYKTHFYTDPVFFFLSLLLMFTKVKIYSKLLTTCHANLLSNPKLL